MPVQAGASRIILGLDSRARTATALDVVRCILSENVTELLSVFVADVELLAHARSRLAREVLLSGAARRLDSEAVGRQMRALSSLAQRELDTGAARLGLQHSFRFARDETVIELAAEAHEADTLVVTLSEAFGIGPALRSALVKLVAARLRILMFAREAWQRERTVALIVDASTDRSPAPRVAQRLSEHSGSALVLIAAGDKAAARGARKRLVQEGIQFEDETFVDASNDAIVEAVRRSRARAVVMPWHHHEQEAALLERLLTETSATVALVGE
jgi:hypothetical protein